MPLLENIQRCIALLKIKPPTEAIGDQLIKLSTTLRIEIDSAVDCKIINMAIHELLTFQRSISAIAYDNSLPVDVYPRTGLLMGLAFGVGLAINSTATLIQKFSGIVATTTVGKQAGHAVGKIADPGSASLHTQYAIKYVRAFLDSLSQRHEVLQKQLIEAQKAQETEETPPDTNSLRLRYGMKSS